MPNPLTLYDNYTRALRPFAPLHSDGEVGLYTCGPTVYNYRTSATCGRTCSRTC